MAESLNVIALISGGKDSLYSILHCVKNGHKVVALGNLYPASPPRAKTASDRGDSDEADEHDLNSFMYQTVGHSVIHLYEKALGIPLYRQQIIGTAIQTGISYGFLDQAVPSTLSSTGAEHSLEGEAQDETESLVPLLKRIIAEHPTANALSTGAILSTYQRTRVESVALRLGLVPLSYLWQYPILPPGTQASLLQDMRAVGLDARIVKVASGGLDESSLWENVADEAVIRRIEKAMKRFGTDGDGAILGEGGEFETLVVDGPMSLFKGRIEVQEKNRRIVREGAGSSWLSILDPVIVMKSARTSTIADCRTPDLLEGTFGEILKAINEENMAELAYSPRKISTGLFPPNIFRISDLSTIAASHDEIVYWNFAQPSIKLPVTISDEAENVVTAIRKRLAQSALEPINIVSTLIVLRSMADFAAVNKVYGALFTLPNPPARVTISCGSTMPKDINIAIHLKVHNNPSSSLLRKALHVQSRSYWAPANIGPYSQAISIPTNSALSQEASIWTVSVAGQIPLIPSSMTLPLPQSGSQDLETTDNPLKSFKLQTTLALQHLWRIGRETSVSWWTSAVVYLPRSNPKLAQKRAQIASQAWSKIHVRNPEDDEEEDVEERDLWEEKHYAGMERRGEMREEKRLPDWERVRVSEGVEISSPPFWAVEVEQLPRGSEIEWHAHLGVSGGMVKLDAVGKEGSWVVHKCLFGNRMHLILTIFYSDDESKLSNRLSEAFDVLGGQSSVLPHVYLSYSDDSMKNVDAGKKLAGILPCRGIWDASGARLFAVVLLDIPQ